ncbi:MAG: hypothetical protein B7Z22_00370 [Hyphomonas sp. 32-62-5]|nr:MAG: hypothetical protein B7Z22_00370 [Hyphomonas sp. 32-62-5]
MLVNSVADMGIPASWAAGWVGAAPCGPAVASEQAASSAGAARASMARRIGTSPEDYAGKYRPAAGAVIPIPDEMRVMFCGA